MSRMRLAALAACLLLAGLGAGAGLALMRGKPVGAGGNVNPPGPRSTAQSGWPFHRLVPGMRLTTSHGVRLSLRALRGRVVVLAPSLTLCHEICPLTTQAFMTMQRTLERDRLSRQVAFVEATADPWRDSPARLRAYAHMTGARFLQLTGRVPEMRRFWNFFGIGFRRVPQGKPADVDWWTHRPERFDVEHVDGVFLIDRRGYERVFYPGIANVDGRLKPALRRLLSSDGLENLRHPLNAWTEPELMAGVGRLLGAHLPRSS